jgi:hypothetical protein
MSQVAAALTCKSPWELPATPVDAQPLVTACHLLLCCTPCGKDIVVVQHLLHVLI